VAGVDPGRVKALAAALTAIATPDQDVELPTAPEIPRMHSAQVQAAIAAALVAGDCRIWLRYADHAGADTLYFVKPLHLAGGVCEAFDVNRAKSRRFAVSRVIGVVPA
jgi:predicted DNA-binding transcriptional regulator YafY